MRNLLIAVLLFAASSRAEPSLELTDCNFYKRTTTRDYVLVLYTASWCAHCARVQIQLQRTLKFLRDHPKLAVGYVDCDKKGKDICVARNVTDYPSLKLYHDGQYVKDYNFPRISWNMYKFLRAQVDPDSRELHSVGEFRDFLLEQYDTVLVGFFEEKNTRIRRAFFRLAKAWKERMIFAHSSCEKLLRKEGVYDGVVLFRPIRFTSQLEQDRFLYKGRPVKGEIKVFITKYFHGIIGLRTPFNLKEFINPLVMAYYVDYDDQDKYLMTFYYWRLRLLKTAHKFMSQCHFVLCNKDEFENELMDFGIHFKKNQRIAVAARTIDTKMYVMKEQFSAEAFDRFVQDLLDFKLKPYIKSKPIPRDNYGPVKLAVADNFHTVAVDNNKDTLILFHGPCTNVSEQLGPFDLLAEVLKNEAVVLVKMDASENYVPPEFTVVDYPTIYWMPKANKTSPVLYKGNETLDELTRFVAEMATTELNGFNRLGKAKFKKIEL